MSKLKNEMTETKKEDTALAKHGASQRGFGLGVEQEDLIIPKAKLIQAMSPELTKENIEGLKPGSIVNSLTKEILPPEFIPIFFYKNFARFNPRSDEDHNFDPDFAPGATIWTSNDPLDPKVLAQAKFGPGGEKPLATTFMNFFSYFLGSEMPIIVSFSKSSYKAGKQLLSLAKFSRTDMFAKKYKLTSAMESNSSGTFAVLKVTAAGDTPPEDFKFCERLWSDFSGRARDIKVVEEETAEERTEDELGK